MSYMMKIYVMIMYSQGSVWKQTYGDYKLKESERYISLSDFIAGIHFASNSKGKRWEIWTLFNPNNMIYLMSEVIEISVLVGLENTVVFPLL